MADYTDLIADMTIAVVDDNRNFLKLVRSILRNFGVKDCTVFDDPVDALTYLEIHAVDCVITDLVMPKMNGFQLAHRIRHSTVIPNRLLPLIMVTGHANRANVAKAVQSGIDEVLVKPFRPTDMQKRLISIASNPRRYIRTPAGFVGVARSDAAKSQLLDRSRTKLDRRTENYFKKKPEVESGTAVPPAGDRPAPSQSDIYTVKRGPRTEPKTRPGGGADETSTWEI